MKYKGHAITRSIHGTAIRFSVRIGNKLHGNKSTIQALKDWIDAGMK